LPWPHIVKGLMFPRGGFCCRGADSHLAKVGRAKKGKVLGGGERKKGALAEEGAVCLIPELAATSRVPVQWEKKYQVPRRGGGKGKFRRKHTSLIRRKKNRVLQQPTAFTKKSRVKGTLKDGREGGVWQNGPGVCHRTGRAKLHAGPGEEKRERD